MRRVSAHAPGNSPNALLVRRLVSSRRSMEIVLYGLLIVVTALSALLVVFLFRGRAVERRLAMLDAVAELTQRVLQVEASLHDNTTAPLERKVDLLTRRLQSAEGRLAAWASGAEPPERTGIREGAAVGSEANRLLAAMQTLGYAATCIVSSESVGGDVREYRVETQKEGLAMKGSVFVANDAIAELRLSPIYELFP